ncbi:MAG: hypothetical protein CM15mP74_22020 [Halieaceae bacterium]|nr:MAG: hypothetical protein CM15mP74_22020 [Halieaceae bacterium]
MADAVIAGKTQAGEVVSADEFVEVTEPENDSAEAAVADEAPAEAADAATEAVVEKAATEETAAAPEETAEDATETPAS